MAISEIGLSQGLAVPLRGAQPRDFCNQEARPQAALILQKVGITIGGRQVVKQIDATFPQRSLTAIIGPTGCGKTTLLRALNRLHDADRKVSVSGSVVLFGRDIYRHPGALSELRRRVGMVFQRPNPFPCGILDNVTVGVRAHGLASRHRAREIGEEMLCQVGLWDAVKSRLNSSPYQLSGGQQQLLCLARALAVDPEVLLLDEPTSSLDPTTTSQVERLISTLKQRMAVVMVTHNLAQARRLADQVLFLLDGSAVEFSESRRFFESPRDPRSVAYIAGEAVHS